MRNPSSRERRAETQYEAYSAHIVSPALVDAQDLKQRSPLLPNGFLERSPQQTQITLALPEHLEKLLDSAWTPEASRLIDSWLWYAQQEFEAAGGAR